MTLQFSTFESKVAGPLTRLMDCTKWCSYTASKTTCIACRMWGRLCYWSWKLSPHLHSMPEHLHWCLNEAGHKAGHGGCWEDSCQHVKSLGLLYRLDRIRRSMPHPVGCTRLTACFGILSVRFAQDSR